MKKETMVAELERLRADGIDVPELTGKEKKPDLDAILKGVWVKIDGPHPDACSPELFAGQDPNSKDCQDCKNDFPAAYGACTEATLRTAAARKAAKTAAGGGSKRVATFEELRDAIVGDDSGRMTILIDKMLLEGHAVKDIVAITSDENTTRGGARYRSAANVYAHINARARQGWVFTLNDEAVEGEIPKDSRNADNTVAVVNYVRPGSEVEEQKAA